MSSKATSTVAAAASVASAYFMPYQTEFILDQSPIVVVEKTRQGGITSALSFKVLIDRFSGARPWDYWYSSADELAAREFILDVRSWCERLGQAVLIAEGTELFAGQAIKRMSVAVPGPDGREHRIHAMTSSPKAFRGKRGDVGLDEFAHHEDQEGIWTAASPATTWGYQAHIISTHKGEDSVFNTRFVEPGKRRRNPKLHGEPRAGDIPVSLHTVSIYDAVAQGMVEKINTARGSNMTREQFIAARRAMFTTQEAFDEECGCIPSSQSGSYFPYDILRPCVDRDAPKATDNIARFLADCASAPGEGLYLGCDVGRKRDRFVVWGGARVGGSIRTAGVLTLAKRRWSEMEAALDASLDRRSDAGRHVVRLCIDETGIGHQLAERMMDKYGHRVEGVTFTGAVKAHLASLARRHAEEKTCTLPDDPIVLAAITSIRREVTASGNIRFDGERNEHGHADEFWAWALSLHAAESNAPRTRTVPVIGGVL